MLTRCPACDTTFRVTPEQLKARRGRVRCGACQHPFDAFEGLLEDAVAVPAAASALPIPPPTPTPTPPPMLTPPPTLTPMFGTHAAAAVSRGGPLPSAPDEIAAEAGLAADTTEAVVAVAADTLPQEPSSPSADDGDTPVVGDTAPDPADASALPVAPPDPAPDLPTAPLPAASMPPSTVEPLVDDAASAAPDIAPVTELAPDPAPDAPVIDTEPFWAVPAPRPMRRWPWWLGSLIALCALVLQATYAFRVELATLQPTLRPSLQAACAALGCAIGYPRKIDLVGIEASDLHPDGERKNALVLTATLRNRAPFVQEYPSLELTLTDTADKAVARKVLLPQDYLPAGLSPRAGMAAQADLAVNIGVDTGPLAASGYRLYLFYP